MSPTVITLIIIGLIFIISSFAISVQLEKEKEELEEIVIPDELEETKKEKIRELVDKYMNEYIDDKLIDIESNLSELVNQRTLALGDYAVSVNDEIEKNHSEVIFLYNMLQEKEKDIKNQLNFIDDMRKEVNVIIEDMKKEFNTIIEETQNRFQANSIDAEVDKELQEAIRNIDERFLEQDLDISVKDDASNNAIILELYKSGLSILEIAKQLGLGVGEVKLVVDLYQGVNK